VAVDIQNVNYVYDTVRNVFLPCFFFFFFPASIQNPWRHGVLVQRTMGAKRVTLCSLSIRRVSEICYWPLRQKIYKL